MMKFFLCMTICLMSFITSPPGVWTLYTSWGIMGRRTPPPSSTSSLSVCQNTPLTSLTVTETQVGERGCAILMAPSDGLVQNCSISSAWALEIQQSCTKPMVYFHCYQFSWCQNQFWKLSFISIVLLLVILVTTHLKQFLFGNYISWNIHCIWVSLKYILMESCPPD